VQALLEGQEVDRELRTEQSGVAASRVAVVPAVRQALLERQRDFRKAPGLVADGRDMGTVVFPDAVLKVFLTASPEARARRRYKQLIEKGISASLPALLGDIRERDERDSKRSVAPLVPARDAIVLDTTDVSLDGVYARVMELAHERLDPVTGKD
jgi:cytidylate kinase